MSLVLESMGTLVIDVDQSWQVETEFGGRTCAALAGARWTNDHFTAEALWINGTYRHGGEAGAPEIRAPLQTADGIRLYLEYAVRLHLPTHTLPSDDPERSAAVMTGRIDVERGPADLAWLNLTQVTGIGTVQLERAGPAMTYAMQVLRWPGDTGPQPIETRHAPTASGSR